MKKQFTMWRYPKIKVLILEFEIIDDSLEELYFAIDASGLDGYVYSATTSADFKWPTMQSLIDADTRLLIFAHGDGIESCYQSTCPDGIFYTFDHFQQTNWDGQDDTCDILGTERPGFFLMNHWKNSDADLPSKANAEDFNTYESLMDRFSQCDDKIPNVVAVDFWSEGDVLPFVKEVNERNAGGEPAVTEARAGGDGRNWISSIFELDYDFVLTIWSTNIYLE